MGLLLGQKILGYNVDYWEVNTEEDYQEVISADDHVRNGYRPIKKMGKTA